MRTCARATMHWQWTAVTWFWRDQIPESTSTSSSWRTRRQPMEVASSAVSQHEGRERCSMIISSHSCRFCLVLVASQLTAWRCRARQHASTANLARQVAAGPPVWQWASMIGATRAGPIVLLNTCSCELRRPNLRFTTVPTMAARAAQTQTLTADGVRFYMCHLPTADLRA